MVERLDCVRCYVDGWRDVVVLSIGRKWFRGFTAATLDTVKLSIEDREVSIVKLEHAGYSRSRLVRRLRANAKIYPPTKEVKEAIAELGRKKGCEE